MIVFLVIWFVGTAWCLTKETNYAILHKGMIGHGEPIDIVDWIMALTFWPIILPLQLWNYR